MAERKIISSAHGNLALAWQAKGGARTGTIDIMHIRELALMAGMDGEILERFSSFDQLILQPGPWQSWSAGWELMRHEHYPKKVRLLPVLDLLNGRAGDIQGRHTVIGHFIAFIRYGEHFLCLAAEGARTCEGFGDEPLPPLSFRFERKTGNISFEIQAKGEEWQKGDRLAIVNVFYVHGVFALRDRLRKIYRQGASFDKLGFLFPQEAQIDGLEAEPVDGNANYPLPRNRVPGGYESWYNHYTNIDEKILLADLQALMHSENFLKLRYLDRKAPLVFQIDDGWEKAVGQWEACPDTFPSGMKTLAKKIEGQGLIPGIWFAPFLVTRASNIWKKKPQWILKDTRGKPLACGYNDQWDGKYYCLDLSQPEVLDYIDGLMAMAIEDWGFRYIKLDFLYTGQLEGAFAKGGSAFRHYRRAIDRLTARKVSPNGLPVAYLGCGLHFQSSYRHFPLSRIGADTRENWDWPLLRAIGHAARPSAWINLRDSLGRSFIDGSVFINDPDVVFMRRENCSLSDTEKELICLVNYLCASQIMFSDNPANFGPEADFTMHILALYDSLDELDDEYVALKLAPDIWKILSRSGRLAGVVNLRSRSANILPLLQAKERELFQKGNYIVDNRKNNSALKVAARSISLVLAPQ